MGDVGDDFNAAREEGKKRRASNRETSPQVLEDNGIEYESKNNGAHLVVHHEWLTADFWPGTGYWKIRGSRRGSRGVFGLIKVLKGE